ncbi:MAG: DUF3261 domain-containing protein [Spirochaetaceae bacterium]|jgi:hypothetical protein|nr:DUF3261 domain-containing protein [Spirochaetaceae bacterium]
MPSYSGFLRFFLVIPGTLLVLGCQNHGPVYLGTEGEFSLLSPEHIEKNIDMFQRINGSYGDRYFDLNAWVRADKTGIVMEILNDLGSSLGELVFTGGELRFGSAYFPQNLPAQYAVADFQLCFYRIPALRSAMGKLRLETETGASVERRLVYDGEELIIKIEKDPASVRYTNYLRGYSYTILGNFL